MSHQTIPGRVLLLALFVVLLSFSVQAQDVFTSPDFLAGNGLYNTPSTTVFPSFYFYGFDITGFSDEQITTSGANDVETADAYLSGILQPTSDGPISAIFVAGAGTVGITIFNGAADGYGVGPTGPLSTQLTSMDFSLVYPVGDETVQFSADAANASTGQGSSESIGGGLFQINSQFDVFADISVNGGPLTEAIGGPTEITLSSAYAVPEPATLPLTLLSLLLLGLGRRSANCIRLSHCGV